MSGRLRNDAFDVIEVLGSPAAIEVIDAPDGIIVVGTPSNPSAPTGAVINIQGVTGMWAGTQADYDAIATKSPTTVYVITS